MKPRSRIVKRVLVVLLIIVLAWGVFAAYLLGTAWRRVPNYEPKTVPAQISEIMSPSEYGGVVESHARPYVYAVSMTGGGEVIVFGAEHTRRADDPQLAGIREQWRSFRPTVALVESDLGMMFPAFMDPVETFGEVGAVHALARRDGASTYSWEPSDERVVRAALDQGFTPRQVALRWILGPYFSNMRHGAPSDPEAFVRDTIGERSRTEGIDGVLTTVADVDQAWRSEFSDGPDWRTVSDRFGLPGVLGQIDLNSVRDEHLVACVAEMLSAGERVFVICGSSHAVKIEPALRAVCK